MTVVARVVTINLWGDREPLASRLDAAATQLLALDPDVVLCQEVRQGQGLPNTAEALAMRLGAYSGAAWQSSFGVAVSGPAGTWGNGTGAGEEGLAILTPHELEDPSVSELPEVRPIDRRVLLSARIGVRGARFAVHTTHLHWRLADGVAREKQVVAVDEIARAYAGSTVHVVGGDFNAAPTTTRSASCSAAPA